MALVDISSLPPSLRESELLRLGAAEARRPFDLARGPLLRSTLLRLGEREHAVLVALHHIVSDAWSLGVLVGEVSALYAAFIEGRPSPLVDLPLQFPDYAEWQRDQLQGEALDAQLAYWQGRLAGAPILDLPTDRPRRAVQRPQVAQLPLSLPPGLAERLRALAQDHGSTPFMVLLAAFEVLLGRYSGQDDLVVGTPVANRRYSDLEKLIGLFVNTLVLRGDLSGDPAFSALLARVRESTLAAWAYQDLPVEKLVAELRLERDLSRAPLFQILFQVQNAPPPEIALAADLILARVPLGTPQAGDYDMVVSLVDTPEGLAGEWIYNTDLFDRATIERMAGHFLHLLAAACADPALRLSELPLADEDELRQLLTWGCPAPLPEVPGGTELRRLFEIHAARDPGHPALAWEGGVLSYGDLNARANRWAWLLRSRGVGPETRVALAVERSPEMIVGLLAVLKAGGAWVPLDPAWPVERLAFMVEDSGAGLLLTQRHLAGQIAVPIPVLLLEDDAAGWSEENPIQGTGPDQAAYVIYTSGSTGRPKGVVAINSGLAAFARSMAGILRAEPADRYLQFPSFSFDASLVSIASVFAAGATLVLHPRVTELSFAELRAFCVSQGVTLVDQPAAFLREIVGQLAASGKPERLFGDAPIRALDTGGESLSRETLHQWARGEGGGTLFLDSYGPTEATVATTIYTVTAREAGRMERATIPLGRPLPGVEVYLLDTAMRLVPLGVPGDLYVGGVGLTRGYLHRPDLTAEAFLPDPLSGRPGARLYRTGDRARWLPDGNLEFLGRRDAQVKIRGFRVELEEIESALVRHPAVAQAAVILLEDRLVAYVVPASNAVGDLTPILRDHLRASLPDPMVPAAFVYMDRLPRTPGGKLDRRNLPRPEATRPAVRDLVPPRDSVEQSIADLWQRLLSLETVGVHDNFFELGGHSLLGTRVIAALREEFGVEVPLRALFEKPTIADLALAVAQARVEQSAASEVDALLDSLEDLTDEEVEALLAAQTGGGEPPV
jgi:amino acid adenylation domain-containing protein